MSTVFKKPSAWVPVALSLAVLATMIISIALFGPPAREADEGVAAHLFQIWLATEVLLVTLFAIKWLPEAPKQALFVIATQIAAVLAACAPVFYFKL